MSSGSSASKSSASSFSKSSFFSSSQVSISLSSASLSSSLSSESACPCDCVCFVTKYHHMAGSSSDGDNFKLKVGDSVKAGDIIGYVSDRMGVRQYIPSKR